MAPRFRLCHVGYLVKDMSEADVLCDRLGYVPESEAVEDEIQTARVRLLRQPGSDTRIEVIMPLGQAGKLTGALSKGGGLHHMCYEVDDLDGARRHLRDRGMLEISAPTPAAAFDGRRIAWFMDRGAMLIELLESEGGAGE